MENRDAKLIKWAKDRIDAEFRGDIALLIGLKGACKLPEDAQDMAFDYFVPATERGYQMAKTFVIEGMGYDLYPNSYERLTRIADLQEPNMIFVLDKGEILYSKNKEEEDKFKALKTLLHQNLADKDKTYQVALEYLNTAMEIFKVLMFEEKMYKVRKAAGGIASFLSHAIALINGKYIVNVYGNLSIAIESLERMPDSYVKKYESLIACKEKEEIKNICKEMIQATRDFFTEIKNERDSVKSEEKGIDYEDLSYWYHEARYTFRKIAYYVEKNAAEECFSLGCYLQIEFDAIREEFALDEMDLLGAFDKDNLMELGKCASNIEQYIRSTITEHGVKIEEYQSFEEFMEKDRAMNEV